MRLNDFDVYQQWLGIPPDRRPPNHYELLGLDFGEDDTERIRAAGLERSATVRRYCLGQHGAEATRLLGEIASAFDCLSDPATKAAYDRQLTDAGADDRQSDADSPPPVQRLLEWSDDDARDYSAHPGGGKTFAAPRSSLWLVRRRSTSSAGPARFSLAACLLLAAACGGIWSARYRPQADTRPQSVAGQKSVAAVRDAKPPRPLWADLAPKSSAPQSASPLAPEEAPSTVGAKNDATERNDAAERTDSAAKSNAKSDPTPAPSEDFPGEQSPADAKMEAAASVAESESAEAPAPRPEPAAIADEAEVKAAEPVTPAAPALPVASAGARSSAWKPGILRKDRAAPFSVAQVTGMEDMDFSDLAEDFGKAWRSERQGQPQVLELTFAAPVSPRLLRVFETPMPAQIDKVVLYPVSGPPQRIKPVKIGFDAANRRARTWSLGSSRPPTERIRITFLPSEEGFVEVNAVALLDQRQRPYYAVAARATSSAAADDPDLLDAEQAFAAEPNQIDAPVEETGGSLEKVNEVIAEAQLDEARNLQTVAAYGALLRDHPRSAAAVEAVRDLAGMISTAPHSEAYSARRVFERLVTRYPDSDAAKAALNAMTEARRRSSHRPKGQSSGDSGSSTPSN